MGEEIEKYMGKPLTLKKNVFHSQPMWPVEIGTHMMLLKVNSRQCASCRIEITSSWSMLHIYSY